MVQKSDTRKNKNKFTLDAEHPTFEGGKVKNFKVNDIVGNETAVSMLFVAYNQLEDKYQKVQKELNQQTEKLHQTELTLAEYKTYRLVSLLGLLISICSGVLTSFAIGDLTSKGKQGEAIDWICLVIGMLLAFLGLFIQQGKWLEQVTKWINKRLPVNQEQ